jgi:hypothetical protein
MCDRSLCRLGVSRNFFDGRHGAKHCDSCCVTIFLQRVMNNNRNNGNDPRNVVAEMRRMREKMKEDLARQREEERVFYLQQKGKDLYHPSVFRYHCYGILKLSSDLEGSEGICQGLATSMEHVRDVRPSTRQQAIDAIVPFPPPDLVSDFQYKDKELQKMMERDALIYDEVKEKSNSHTKANQESSYHDWDLYGSTEVEVLVLKHVVTQKEHVAAVIPRCSLGCSFRDVASQHHSFVYSDLHLGNNTVRLAGLGERNDTDTQGSIVDTNSKQNPNASVTPSTGASSSLITMDNIQAVTTKVAEHATLILSQAYQNSLFVAQEVVSPDFPRKWYDAADRIVHQVPTTVQNVQKYTLWACREGYKWFSGGSGDHHD